MRSSEGFYFNFNFYLFIYFSSFSLKDFKYRSDMIRHAFLKDHPNNDIKGRLMVGDTRIRSTS